MSDWRRIKTCSDEALSVPFCCGAAAIKSRRFPAQLGERLGEGAERAITHLRRNIGDAAALRQQHHGVQDARVIPVANGRLIAQRIPGARLHVLEDAGHLYPTEEPEADRDIARFLADPRQEAA